MGTMADIKYTRHRQSCTYPRITQQEIIPNDSELREQRSRMLAMSHIVYDEPVEIGSDGVSRPVRANAATSAS